MKRKLKKLLAILLTLSLLLGISGCSVFGGNSSKKDDGPAIIYRARIELPYSTGARAVAEQEGAEALGAYLTARAFLKQLEYFDTSDPAAFDANGYVDLLNRTMKALEAADKLAADLKKNAFYLEMLQRNDYVGLDGEATIKFLSPKEVTGSDAGSDQKNARGIVDWLEEIFTIKAKAADDEENQGTLEWAQKFVKKYDEAPAGRGLRTLAEQMGKDVKYVYAKLKQAQALVEKGASDEEADLYNKAYEAAVATKAACSTAGFVVSCVATGGAAAGLAHGIAVAKATVDGVNAILDVGSAYTTITTNGEGDEYTTAFDQTSKDFGVVTFIVGALDAGAGLVSAESDLQVAENMVNTLLFFVGQKEFLEDHSTGKGVFGTVIEPMTDKYVVNLQSTEGGDSPAQQEAMKEVLEFGGVSPKEAEEIVQEMTGGEEETADFANGAVEDRDAKSESKEDQGFKTPADSPQLNPESDHFDDDFPDPIEIISQYDHYTDPEGNFDVDKYISVLRSYLEDLSQLEDLDPAFDAFEEDWEKYLTETNGEDIPEETETETAETEESAEAEVSEMEEASAEEPPEPEPESSASEPEPESSAAEPEPEPVETAADAGIEQFIGTWRYDANGTIEKMYIEDGLFVIEEAGSIVKNSYSYDPSTGILSLTTVGSTDEWTVIGLNYTFQRIGDTLYSYYYHVVVALDDDGNPVYGDREGLTCTWVSD
ncbi:MAG: hypothetical protein IIY45_05565 [Firmicutes bacterium]|nr:hypothetical protein [Bacillota bacterium]